MYMSIPISLPLNMRHCPSGCSSAAARRSASGSFASTTVAPLAAAALNESSNAPFPSSGFGYATVGKEGSGEFCSGTITRGLCANTSKAFVVKGVPTPCIAV